MPGAFPTHLSSHHACKVPCLAHMKSANRQKHAGSCRVPSCKLERKRHGIWSRDCGMCPMKQWRVNCSNYEPFPFDDGNYFRVFLQMIVRDASDSIATGTLVLLRDQLSAKNLADLSAQEGQVEGLAIQVGGDTLQSISSLASGNEPIRPNSLNLMHQIMEKLQKKKGNKWKLLKVGIVDYRDGIFYGRLFFGDPETEEVAWDCDCRPSDGCWLSLKTQCPLYLHRKVWDICAGPLGMTTLQEGTTDFELEPEGAGADPMTSIMPGDLEVIRRLKREMSVAVAEEDYETAKRLRDHPYMQKYKLMQEFKSAGRHADAAEAFQSLVDEIEQNEERQAGNED